MLVDTNIILYLIDGNTAVSEALQGRSIAVSVITEMEVLSYHGLQKNQESAIKAMFSEMLVMEMNPVIKEKAIEFRRNARLKLPDAIIAATAVVVGVPLFTADLDFKKIKALELLLLE